MKLSEAMHSLSAKLFPTVDGVRRPNYGAIFVEAVGAVLEARKVKFDRATLEKIAEHVNLSSYQRAAAGECAKRYGKVDDKTGQRVMGEASKAPKAAKTGVAAIDGVRRRKDPISGQPVKKAKAAKPVAEKAPKMKPAKAAKPVAEKAPKTAKAKKAEIDPISGKPV